MTNNIAKLIEESGKKIKTISEALDISYPTLSSYNQGIRKPKKENAQKLADYFGVSVAHIMGIDKERNAPNNMKIIADSFKVSEITSVTPFRNDMDKLKKSIELGELHLSMPLNETFSDEFRRILAKYLINYEETFIKDLIKFMNNQGQKSDIWKTWIQTEEFQIRRADRDRK